MTRTLWVTNDFPPRPGGIEHFVAGLVSRLPPADTEVLTARWLGDLAFDAAQPYRVRRIGGRPLLPTPLTWAKVVRVLREHDPEVVVFGAAWPLGELARRLDAPTFTLTHGHEAGMARVGMGPLLRRVARGVDAVGVISEFTHRVLEPWMGKHTELMKLPPGVDTNRFNPDVDGSGVRARHGIGHDQPLVVCIARLVDRKGQDVLIDGWPSVLDRIPGAHLLLVGVGPDEHPLRRRRENLGLERSVTFTGVVSYGDLPAYHAAADLFAMPCRTRLAGLDVEGLGIVYLEAQACGRPVVVGSSGGAPETVLDGGSGVVVDGTSQADVAAAVADLLADPQRRASMGEEGRGFVEREYSWDVTIQRLDRILGHITGASR